MGQPVVHFEFWSENTESLSEFYSSVFDWKIRHVPEMNYHLIDPDNEAGIGGGMMTPQKGPWPGNLTFYIDVDDLDTFLDILPSTEVGGFSDQATAATRRDKIPPPLTLSL